MSTAETYNTPSAAYPDSTTAHREELLRFLYDCLPRPVIDADLLAAIDRDGIDIAADTLLAETADAEWFTARAWYDPAVLRAVITTHLTELEAAQK